MQVLLNQQWKGKTGTYIETKEGLVVVVVLVVGGDLDVIMVMTMVVAVVNIKHARNPEANTQTNNLHNTGANITHRTLRTDGFTHCPSLGDVLRSPGLVSVQTHQVSVIWHKGRRQPEVRESFHQCRLQHLESENILFQPDLDQIKLNCYN